MKTNVANKQSGAVLAFSLVMLLLLTLVGISVIQQNKAQITIATNVGQQVTTFTSVEAALAATQDILMTKRYYATPYPPDPAATTHCKSGATNSVNENDILTDASSPFTAVVKAEYCISNYDSIRGGGNEYRCFYNSNGTRSTVVGSIVPGSTTPLVYAKPSSDEAAACDKLTAAGWQGAGIANPNYCQIETYTIQVTLDDITTSAKRTVESKFQIDCSGDRYG